MQHGMTSTIRHTTRPMRLLRATHFQTLTSKSSLVDFPVGQPAERHSVVFQLNKKIHDVTTAATDLYDGLRRFLAHILNGVLITEPIGALDGVIKMVHPRVCGVLVNVSQRCIDSTLAQL